MKRFLLAVALTMTAAVSNAPAQSMQSAYDAMGRLKCVKYADGKVTKYVYDPAGNRVSVTTTASGTCQGQSGGETPPVAPEGGQSQSSVTLTPTNPTNALASQGVSTLGVVGLGSASDSSALTVQAAVTGGSVAGCGTVAWTTAAFTYTAPLVTPVGATRQCWVDYTLLHPNNQTAIGRATYNVAGEEDPGNGGPGDPPPCEVNCGNEN